MDPSRGGHPSPTPPPPHKGGLVGRLTPVCARRCGRVCGAVRVLRCNAICSFCSTRQVAALSQLTCAMPRRSLWFAAPQPSANQVRCNAPVANALCLLPIIDPSGRCGNHGREGHTVLPFSPTPIPSKGWEPWTLPTHPTGGRGACTVIVLPS